MTDTVTVPRELLRWVLEDARRHAEICRGWVDEAHGCKVQQAKIAELRRIAGMDDEPDTANWRWWYRGDQEDGLLGFATAQDRDAFSRGDDGPFRRILSDDGRTIRQGETWREMMDRMSNTAGLEE